MSGTAENQPSLIGGHAEYVKGAAEVSLIAWTSLSFISITRRPGAHQSPPPPVKEPPLPHSKPSQHPPPPPYTTPAYWGNPR